MRVFVTGATGVLGRSAVAALVAEGHEVTGLARTDAKAAYLRDAGATPCRVSLFDVENLTTALAGHDAVCNLATAIPVGTAALRPGAWRANDRLRIEGSQAVATAARNAGVRRLVQESVSFLYADAGDAWISETSPLCVTPAVEPAAVAETAASNYACSSRQPVVLRFAHLVGDDPFTRWRLSQVRAGHPIGLGDPDGWASVVHPQDAGAAVVAALTAPGGVYNVAAEPVRRGTLARTFADAAGSEQIGFVPRWLVRLGGERLEPLTRSQRVSAGKLQQATGWKALHDAFDSSWLHASPA